MDSRRTSENDGSPTTTDPLMCPQRLYLRPSTPITMMYPMYVCLMIEEYGSISLTNGSGSGRPKNIGTDLEPDPQQLRVPIHKMLVMLTCLARLSSVLRSLPQCWQQWSEGSPTSGREEGRGIDPFTL